MLNPNFYDEEKLRMPAQYGAFEQERHTGTRVSALYNAALCPASTLYNMFPEYEKLLFAE